MNPEEVRAHYENRFDTIESKVDKITEAVEILARVEERQIAANKRVDRIEWRMDQQEAHIDGLASRLIENQSSLKAGERIVWTIGALVMSLLAAMFGTDFGS